MGHPFRQAVCDPCVLLSLMSISSSCRIRHYRQQQQQDVQHVDRLAPADTSCAGCCLRVRCCCPARFPPPSHTELFRQYFEQFGKVVEAQIMVDHTSGRSRGFG